MLVADGHTLRLQCSGAAPGHPLRTTGLIRQLPITGLPAPQPLVAHIRTNPEPPAELPAVRSFSQSKTHELTSLIHYLHLVPGPGRPPESDQSSSFSCVSYFSENPSVIFPD